MLVWLLQPLCVNYSLYYTLAKCYVCTVLNPGKLAVPVWRYIDAVLSAICLLKLGAFRLMLRV